MRTVARAPAYPLMLMLDLYAFGRPDGGRGALPKSCEVDWVRGWRARRPGDPSRGVTSVRGIPARGVFWTLACALGAG